MAEGGADLFPPGETSSLEPELGPEPDHDHTATDLMNQDTKLQQSKDEQSKDVWIVLAGKSGAGKPLY